MIGDVHAPAADAANRQTLEQRRAFSWWTLAALWAERMSVFPKPPLILLVFFPCDVTGMRASEQRVPFLLRQFYLMNPVQRFARAGFAIREGSCIAGVMQDEQRFVEIEFLPQQLTILRPTSQPAGKQQVRLAEGSHHGTRGTQTTEGLKQKPDALLNLLIGIQRHLALRIINKADRKRHV
jgi:hypothetical protein